MLRNIKNLKVGDIITFYGKLYDSDKYSKQLAKTIIQYKILSISTKGVLIETSNKYIFNAGTCFILLCKIKHLEFIYDFVIYKLYFTF